MQYAVNTVHEMLERYHITQLNKYFDEEGSPATKEIWLDGDRKMEVPINQRSQSIEEMEIAFKTRIDRVALKGAKSPETGKDIEVDRMTLEMNFTPSTRDGNSVDIRIKFKSVQPPEGVSRIVDEYN